MSLTFFEQEGLTISLPTLRQMPPLEAQIELKAPTDQGPVFIGQSPTMKGVLELVEVAGRTDAPVLLQGERGVGKSLIARMINERSERRKQPFVQVNLAAVPEALLEPELFGYERGAFTGGVEPKRGNIELADKGTIFLDDIVELGPNLQAKLLHFLQDRRVPRLGGQHPVEIDVRVLAATNATIQKAIKTGRLRKDYYYCLNVLPINVPPLRERRATFLHFSNTSWGSTLHP